MQKATSGAAAAAPALSDIQVLVVEDNDASRRVIEMTLKDLGVGSIYWANDSGEGAAVFEEKKPNLVLIDWDLGSNDGLNLGKKIKEQVAATGRDVGVILSVAFSERERILEAVQAGLMNIMAKPVTSANLKKQILKIVAA